MLSTYTKLIVYFIIRLIGRANAIRPYTNKDEIDWANAIRPYGRNSTRAGGFRATRTLRVSAACAQRKRLCRRGFNRPVKLILI